MIFPERDEIIVYRCSRCNLYFRSQLGKYKITCAVLHAPGTCCHYAEKQLTDEQVKDILS